MIETRSSSTNDVENIFETLEKETSPFSGKVVDKIDNSLEIYENLDSSYLAEESLRKSNILKENFVASAQELASNLFESEKHLLVHLPENIRGFDTMPLDEIIDGLNAKAEFLQNRFKRHVQSILNGDAQNHELSPFTQQRVSERINSINEFVASNESDQSMFRALFDREPNGDIKIVCTPFTVEIYMDRADYNTPEVYDPQNTNAKGSASAAGRAAILPDSKIKNPSLAGAVIVVNRESLEYKQLIIDNIVAHERQHVFRNLVDEDFWAKSQMFIDFDPKEDLSILSRLPANRKADFYKGYLETVRDFILEANGKNEILAYTRQGAKPELIKYLVNEQYKGADIEDIDELNQICEAAISGGVPETDVNFINSIVFGWGYRSQINEAVDTIEALKRKGYTNGEVATMLTTKTMSSWKDLLESQL